MKIFLLAAFFYWTSLGYTINSTGPNFPNRVLGLVSFSYFFETNVSVIYNDDGAQVGVCNILGYWHPSNTEVGATVGERRRDGLICTDKCTVSTCGNDSSRYPRFDKFDRHPIVDFAAFGIPPSDNDYKYFPDLQLFPALADGIVPIFNIPELTAIGKYLVLSRTSLARIFKGEIRYWNDSRVVNDNRGDATVENILSGLHQEIQLVVKQESSSVTLAFTKGLSLFDVDTGAQEDNLFNNTIGESQTPAWCDKVTDEIDKLVVWNCSNDLSFEDKMITLTIFSPSHDIGNVSFVCDASESEIENAFASSGVNGMAWTNVTVRKEHMSCLNCTGWEYYIGYSDERMTGIDWWEPIIEFNSQKVNVSLKVFQEGGLRNSHFNSSAYMTYEVQSIFFDLNLVNKTLLPRSASGLSVSIETLKNGSFETSLLVNSSLIGRNEFASELYNALNGMSSVVSSGSSCVSEVQMILNNDSSWVEYRLYFSPSFSSLEVKRVDVLLKSSGIKLTSNISDCYNNGVFVMRQLQYDNYPFFYDHWQPLTGKIAGRFYCYKRSLGYQPLHYYAGNFIGVLAAVSNFSLLKTLYCVAMNSCLSHLDYYYYYYFDDIQIR